MVAFVSSAQLTLCVKDACSFVPKCNVRVGNVCVRHVQRARRLYTPVATATTTTTMTSLERVSGTLTNLFPVWTVVASLVALAVPVWFGYMGAGIIRVSLALLMLSTGLTLTFDELKNACRRPVILTLSLIGCFGIMPLLAILLSRLFALSPAMTAGLVLIGIVSGGQASNLCTHIAGGDTALSVAMTTSSTICATFALPLLSTWLLGTSVAVDASGLAISTAQVVLLPVCIGALLSSRTKHIHAILPVIGIALVVILIVGPVASTATLVKHSFLTLAPAVCLLHLLGGCIGYIIAKCTQNDERVSRAVAFEMGFKSPALSFVLASAHFADVAVRLPSAVSIIVLAPLAALFAVIFRAFPVLLNNDEQKRRHGALSSVCLDGECDSEHVDVMWMPYVESDKSCSSTANGETTRYRIELSNGAVRSVTFNVLSAELRRLKNRGLRIKIVKRL